MASFIPTERAIPNYYFAFGSNMHLTQMASRCPDSRIIARGILRGYRWQINERGVANIVYSKARAGEQPAFVEGILYTVSFKDIRTLDRNEGISKQFYDKALVPIHVEPLAISALEGMKTAVAAEELELVRLQSQSQSQSYPRAESWEQSHGHIGRSGKEPTQVQALVYLSSLYKTDGYIRSEYIRRMELAMGDALKLGVDELYLQKSLYPLVFVEEPRVASSAQTEQRILERKPAEAIMSHDERGHGASRQPEPRTIEVAPRTTSKPQLERYPVAPEVTDGRKRRMSRQHQRHAPKTRDHSLPALRQSDAHLRTDTTRRYHSTSRTLVRSNSDFGFQFDKYDRDGWNCHTQRFRSFVWQRS